ncbi:MAG: histone [Simkaniaceae bacterium]|nr:histone [Candidatus Sacchlamyda saccharinae]
MALKTTVEHMKQMLLEISHDLEKAGRGNRAAAQRVRTNTIKFAKIAKQYRKESVAEGRKGAKKKKTTKKKAAPKRKVVKKKIARKKTTATKKKVVRKTVKRKTTARKRKR